MHQQAGPSNSGLSEDQTPEEAAKKEAVLCIVEQAAAGRFTTQVVTPNAAAVERQAQHIRTALYKAATDLTALAGPLAEAVAADEELLRAAMAHPGLGDMAKAKLAGVLASLDKLRPPLAFALASTSDPLQGPPRVYESPAISDSCYADIAQALQRGVRAEIGIANFSYSRRGLDLNPRPEAAPAGRARPQPPAAARAPGERQPAALSQNLPRAVLGPEPARSKRVRMALAAVLAVAHPVLKAAGLEAAFCGYANHATCRVEVGQTLCGNTLALIAAGKLTRVEDTEERTAEDGAVTTEGLGTFSLRDAKGQLSGSHGGVQCCERTRAWIAIPPAPPPGQQAAPQLAHRPWPPQTPLVWASSVKAGWSTEKSEDVIKNLMASPALASVWAAMADAVGDLFGPRCVG